MYMKGTFTVYKFDENWLSSTSYRDTSSEIENNNLVLLVNNYNTFFIGHCLDPVRNIQRLT